MRRGCFTLTAMNDFYNNLTDECAYMKSVQRGECKLKPVCYADRMWDHFTSKGWTGVYVMLSQDRSEADRIYDECKARMDFPSLRIQFNNGFLHNYGNLIP